MSSSLVVLCSNHERTEETNPHQLATDCLQSWHPPHRAAEKGSSLTCISYTCSRTAKFVVWLQTQAVESRKDVTTEQPAVDHIPPASGLTHSKKNRENIWKLPSTSTESQGVKRISFSQQQQSRKEVEEDTRDRSSHGLPFGSSCISADLLRLREDQIQSRASGTVGAITSCVQKHPLPTFPKPIRASYKTGTLEFFCT